MMTREKERRPSGLPLVGLSIGTFGLGVYIAARQQKKARLSSFPIFSEVDGRTRTPCSAETI
jgi:hypothetical protein